MFSKYSTFLILSAGLSLALASTSPDDGYQEGSSSSSSSKTSCVDEKDCPTWGCECAEGPPINSRSCRDGYCADPEDFCGDHCAHFGTTWTGNYFYVADPERAKDSGSASRDSGGVSHDSGGSDAGASTCEHLFRDNTCGRCGKDNCCQELAACDGNDCWEILECIVACVNQGASQSYCEVECIDYFPDGASDYSNYDGCMRGYCHDECY